MCIEKFALQYEMCSQGIVLVLYCVLISDVINKYIVIDNKLYNLSFININVYIEA